MYNLAKEILVLEKKGFEEVSYKNTYFDENKTLKNYNYSLEKEFKINDSGEGLQIVGIILKENKESIICQIFNCSCYIDCCGELFYEGDFSQEILDSKIEELKENWKIEYKTNYNYQL